MQDEINEKVIALSIRTTKLTAEMLQKSIRFMLSQIKKQLDKPVQHHGKQTLKQLMKQNAGVSSIEITDSNIKAFESTAKKYGVDFALKKDATESPPRYLVFFKGRDADVLTAAFQEFSAKKLTLLPGCMRFPSAMPFCNVPKRRLRSAHRRRRRSVQKKT